MYRYMGNIFNTISEQQYLMYIQFYFILTFYIEDIQLAGSDVLWDIVAVGQK